MTLKSIFNKPIDRPIEGVIKADDEASLRIEIEEYVLTNEVEKRLESFLSVYNNYQGANGVWISGFFGSGKSHLLKMLALILENRSVNEVAILDSFLSKCVHNEILKRDLKRAVSIPSKSILFNIDQKAVVISKTQTDALLGVFVKVFDEICGYYGKQDYIAQFERDLDNRDQYDAFKVAYREIAGKEWHFGREQALLESHNIAQAYAQVTNTPPEPDILNKYRTQYKVSIEDFAEQIRAYVDKRSPDFRLNFFVDEVGQYIANNVKLMTNLQTIAESLATKCRGRAWVIVTAQEDMDTVVGEKSLQQTLDFSKIQARFANRMKLTSADVAEVIQKRLLKKNESGINLLSELYHQQSNNFKTLFDFADGSQTYRNFKDREHFIESYPFIPYQFALFQSAIQNLSVHNAFEGKHSSVGERSMLGVFQQVAIQIQNYEVGQLASFDLMFEGIRSALKSNIQRAILQAEKHLDNAFAIQLLKALFLVKYVKEFKATTRNLSVLMLDRFERDLPQLRKQIEEALNILEQQTYIQRNGESYEYLTDEEKDIEEEIKNTEVERTLVDDELQKLIFDYALKLKKIRAEDSEQDYSFTKKMDDRLYGRDYELAIHIITPFYDNADNETILKMQSMGRDELVVVMPPDDLLIRDILMYKRTEKYISQNVSITQKDNVKAILTAKAAQNTQRYSELQQRIQNLLGKAKLIIEGSNVEIASEDPKNRIEKAFVQLILKAYPHRSMLRGVTYTEQDITKFLHQGNELFPDNLSESEQELFAFIQQNKKGGVRTTLKQLLDRFERKPYGWYYTAILCTVAKLCVRGKLEVRSDGNLLDGDDLENALKNSRNYGNVILEPQIDFSAAQVRKLKDFYDHFFDKPSSAAEGKTLGTETGKAFAELIKQMEALILPDSIYPFRDTFMEAIATLKQLQDKSYSWYLTDLLGQEDELLDLKEETIEPIRAFMTGQQKGIFDQAYNFVREQGANFTYIQGDELEKTTSILHNPRCFQGASMQQLKTLVDALQIKVCEQIETEIKRAKEKVEELKNKLFALPDYVKLYDEQKLEIIQPFTELTENIARERLIPVIRDKIRSFEDNNYTQLLTLIDTWSKVASPSDTVDDITISGDLTQVLAPEFEYVSSRSIVINFDKPYLGDRSDVERYLDSLRMALLAEIEKGNRIAI